MKNEIIIFMPNGEAINGIQEIAKYIRNFSAGKRNEYEFKY